MDTSLNCSIFFFFNDTATTEIYTLSLHDALPICDQEQDRGVEQGIDEVDDQDVHHSATRYGITDRKSTRLNSSHSQISYAVFCLKKKKKLNHLSLIIMLMKTTTIIRAYISCPVHL